MSYVCPAKTQICLCIYTVWSVFANHMKMVWALGFQKKRTANTLIDQTAHMRRLICLRWANNAIL